jgi:hypothetical protein
MKTETKARLRAAAIEALRDGDDDGALELLTLIGVPPFLQQLPPEPVQAQLMPDLTDLPLPHTQDAHDVYAWAMAIEKFFLPNLASRGRTDFTTPEMLSWFETSGFPFTTGDLEVLPGHNRMRWRCIAGNALTKLRESGSIFQRGYFSRTYTTVRPVGILAPE